jgi:hypothetical protein
MPDPKPPIVEIEDAHGNKITLKDGTIKIESAGILELKAPVIIVNGRTVTPSSNPI